MYSGPGSRTARVKTRKRLRRALTAIVTLAGVFTFAASLPASAAAAPDLATSMRVASENYTNASVTVTVTNLGGTASVPATMTIDADPTQNFSYEAGAGTDCTAQSINNFGVFGSKFTCPVPGGIAPGGTYTRTLTIQNLSGQAPHYVQCDATTIMPGDANSSNNKGYATVIFN
jgi:hypothetical protein